MSLSETDTGMLWLAHVPKVLPLVRPIRYVVVEGTMRGRRGGDDFYVKAGISGFPDCQVFADRRAYPTYYVEVEWKARKGVMREAQFRRRAFCERNSIPYLVMKIERDERTEDTLVRWTEILHRQLVASAPRPVA